MVWEKDASLIDTVALFSPVTLVLKMSRLLVSLEKLFFFSMFYALSVVAVDGICEPGMLAVGFIVVVGLLFICCCCYCGCCFLGRRRRGRLNLLEDL